MNRSRTDFRHVLSWTVFLMWGGIFGIYYFSGDYVDFLNPQFGWLMLIGFILSIVFFLIFFLSGPEPVKCGQDDETGVSQVVDVHLKGASVFRMLILLVPVLFAANFGSWQLDSFAFAKRAVGLTRFGGQNWDKKNASAADKSPNLPEIETGEVSLIEIHSDFERLEGKTVITRGMFLSDTPGIPEDSWVVFRFMIMCCAADAQPLTVMIKGKRPPEYADGTWVQIEGRVQKMQINGNDAVVIEAEHAQPACAPQNPYLLPLPR